MGGARNAGYPGARPFSTYPGARPLSTVEPARYALLHEAPSAAATRPNRTPGCTHLHGASDRRGIRTPVDTATFLPLYPLACTAWRPAVALPRAPISCQRRGRCCKRTPGRRDTRAAAPLTEATSDSVLWVARLPRQSTDCRSRASWRGTLRRRRVGSFWCRSLRAGRVDHQVRQHAAQGLRTDASYAQQITRAPKALQFRSKHDDGLGAFRPDTWKSRQLLTGGQIQDHLAVCGDTARLGALLRGTVRAVARLFRGGRWTGV